MPQATTDVHTPNACRPLAAAVAAVLGELRAVVMSVDAGQYAAKSGPLFAGASLGGHVRHCLDHARALVDAQGSGPIEYDHRERGTIIETDPSAAIAELDRVISGLGLIAARPAEEPLTVGVMPSREGRSVELRSTLGRELAFVLSHTIHHNATVRGMIVATGRPLPEGFGYAPSTLAHNDRLTQAAGDRSACAR